MQHACSICQPHGSLPYITTEFLFTEQMPDTIATQTWVQSMRAGYRCLLELYKSSCFKRARGCAHTNTSAGLCDIFCCHSCLGRCSWRSVFQCTARSSDNECQINSNKQAVPRRPVCMQHRQQHPGQQLARSPARSPARPLLPSQPAGLPRRRCASRLAQRLLRQALRQLPGKADGPEQVEAQA